MINRRFVFASMAATLVLAGFGSHVAIAQTAQDKAAPIKVVATFSILGDLVKNVGGDRVEVETLVGPNGDTHVFVPSPKDAKKLADAKVVFVNGLGFEGWMTRLVKAAGRKVPLVTVTRGITPLTLDAHGHDHKGHSHDAHDHTDPHAWQSVANVKIYVANIRDGLIAADPADKSIFEKNAEAYVKKLDQLEADVKALIAKIPPERRRIITTHDAFGYFAAAYGMQFVAPQGVSTDSEASARDVAKIITQIKKEKIPAVFLENVSDKRLIDQIAKETGAKIGGTLYSDALSDLNGPAPTYLALVHNNVRELTAALEN